MVEDKYEICTDLPLARARHFESDERYLSPALVTTYHCLAHPGELDEDERATLRHIFFARLLFDRVVVGLGSWDSGASESACSSSSC